VFACVDVDYRSTEAMAGCLLFNDFKDAHATTELVAQIQDVKPYVSGQFYLRELPCLLSVLSKVQALLDAVIVDGYVWLNERPGLGAYLYGALKTPVIGVAKTHFQGATLAQPVLRGQSLRPLYVSSIGIDSQTAAENIKQMHGAYRIPTLLQRVDFLCRTAGVTSRSHHSMPI
jgi:deoxyribonuclease V